MNEKFIPSKTRYATARYSSKRIGVGVAGESAFMYVTPREGDQFDDELIYTIHLMSFAPEMYDMLKTAAAMFDGTEFSKRANDLLSRINPET